MFGINPFQVTAPFLPPENTKKSEVFSCFQEVKRGALVWNGLKLLKKSVNS